MRAEDVVGNEEVEEINDGNRRNKNLLGRVTDGR